MIIFLTRSATRIPPDDLLVMWFGVALLLATNTVLLVGSSSGGTGNSQAARCIGSERQALLNFKQHLVDTRNLLSSWNIDEEEDCCKWSRITCDNQINRVINVDLNPLNDNDDESYYFVETSFSSDPQFYFGGEIDPSLAELPHLKYLDLSLSNFTRIPEFIGSFSKLEYLNLLDNPIAETPSQVIGNLKSLRNLLLGKYDYEMVADNLEWLSNLSSLRVVVFKKINFKKVVDWLQQIKLAPSLTTLAITRSLFPKVDLFTLSHHNLNYSNSLTTLHMEYNTIHATAIPWIINVSSNLVDFTFRLNNIGGSPLPNSFRTVTSLKSITIYDNGFEGELPKSLGNLCNLQTLDLSRNSFHETLLKDFVGSLADCTKKSLKTLDLSSNQLGGSFPDMKEFTSLQELYLSENRLEGPLSDLQQVPSTLEILDASSNSFTGAVSNVHLQNLYNLQELDLSYNSLTFNVTSNWVPTFQLITIKLSSCMLGPHFPNWLKTQLLLSHLDISNTSISGAIPFWFYNMTYNFTYLNLSFNHISTWPNFPLRFDNHPRIDLSSNQFHGSVPLSLSNATVLNLSNNMFTRFESFLCTLKDRPTSFLDISNNLLSGSLPNCWNHWEQLQILVLDNNKLHGIIPSSFASLYQIQSLSLRKNNLSGNLASSLKNCTQLKLLDMGKNNLTGNIPIWIGESLTSLLMLSLKSNGFHGSIPSKLCHLRSIQVLDLSVNDISGGIPSCIDNFTSMSTMTFKGIVDQTIYSTYFYGNFIVTAYDNSALLVWKGKEYKYDRILGLLRVIDLSSNRLRGEIPVTLTNLVQLVHLNLSRNNLSGIIPMDIGELDQLQGLDLSHNHLSGHIPMSLAKIYYLAYLDMSNNNLSGKIPTSTQLLTFNASAYRDNPGLCGRPLEIMCPGDQTVSNTSKGGEDDDGDELINISWFYMGIGVGFALGFWGVCGTLAFKTSWRHAYFQSLNKLGDWLCVTIMVQKNRLRRRVQS
ncbi:hypothetical protein FNV43_RR23077 [Rhamnella rubrinervis]|uniref:Leucine-rich repeat-containing N-terminal plant-type domain-containing protein n=1 Tax=Rhamnella rubrinervis TaxID=2594499 RepID=A0A8K0GVQ0_9ROSA|nr:hypothetical protein FNV43_RR23077 [Rhamnella rubrinervis]